MKTATFAATAAGLLGSVVAQDSSDWEQWTSSKPVDPVTTTVAPISSTVDDWEQWTTTKTPKPVDPIKSTTTTWYEWTTTTTPKPVEPTSSSSTAWNDWEGASSANPPKPVEPASSAPATWSNWESTYTGPFVTSTQTYTSTVYSTITVYPNDTTTTVTATATWSNWVSATLPGQCAMAVVTSYGSPTWKPTPATPASSAAASTWAAWSSSSNPVVPVSSASASTWAAWSTPSASSGSGKGISANGNKLGMTYSPYTPQGGCKDAATVEADIAKLASLGFSSVRVYSTDCDTLPNVGGAARKNGLKLILGVFISDSGISGAQPQVTEICEWAQWDIVELIVVGNECVFQGHCTAGDLGAFIGSSKSAFQAHGYTGACTTTDELSVWQQYGSQWCDVVDVVAANLYAFFNPDVEASGAGAFIQAEIDALNKICPGKPSYVMESGWPSEAISCNGKACASKENQAIAIKGILETSGSEVVFFSFEDEKWKPSGQWGAEQHFGCADVFAN